MAISEDFATEISEAVDATVAEAETTQTETQEEVQEEVQEETQTIEESNGDNSIQQVADGVSEETTDEAARKEDRETQEEEVETQEEAQPNISYEAIARANQVGLSVADIRSFPNEQSLLAVCKMLEQSVEEVASETQKTAEDPLEAFTKLDPEVYDPDVIKLFSSMAEEVRSQREQVQALQSGIEQSVKANQAANAQEVEHFFDKQVAGLGEEFSDVLGKGGYSSLEKGGLQLAKREAIADQMAVLLAGYQATGKAAPPREEVFDLAAKLVLKEEYARIEQRKMQAELRERSKQHLQRPSGSGQKIDTVSPQDEAAAALKEKYGI